MEKSPFSHDLFKPIMNKLRSFDPIEVISIVARKLHQVEGLPISDWNGWYPWFLCLIIKWGLEFGGENSGIKEFNEKKLANLLEKVKDFDGKCGNSFLESDIDGNVLKFLRTRANQQFWIQLPLGSWNIARQYLLFNDLILNEDLRNAFKGEYDVSIIEFLDLSFLIWTWLSSHPGKFIFFEDILFSKTKIPQEKINNYFNCFSLDITNAKSFLSTRANKIEKFCFQLIEPTPFTEKPFFRKDKGILVYSKRILEKMINEYIYNQIKYNLHSDIAVSFASDFEKYIDNALSTLKFKYLSEKQLMKIYPGSKVTDFLIASHNSTVFIEVKSQDINPKVVVFPDNPQLKNELKDSIVKATIQAITLINVMDSSHSYEEGEGNKEPFLLIITYKNLYLGNGRMMWDEFLGSAVLSKLDSSLDVSLLPPENIAVLSIEEFDLLMAYIEKGLLTIDEVLRKMVLDNASSVTMKMNFSQHLPDNTKSRLELSYLDSTFKSHSTRLRDFFLD